MKKIVIIPYDSEWPEKYQREAAFIEQALGSGCLKIHHIGSTSVPGLNAKPKIDILVVVQDFKSLNISALEEIGFENRGEIIASGRYFSKRNSIKVNLHVFEEGNPLIEDNLLFRDWLRTHNADRDAYARLKQELAPQHTDGMEYCRAKTEFILGIVAKAKNQ